MNSPIEHDSPGGLVVAPATVETVMALADELVGAAARESIASCKGGFDVAKDALRAEVSRLSAAPVQEPVAWMHEDGRVINGASKAGLVRDGGASASSMAGYTIPLYTAPQPAPAGQLPVHRNLTRLAEALRQQIQVDEDGTLCGISRQAADEAATLVEQLAALSPDTQVKPGNTNEQGG